MKEHNLEAFYKYYSNATKEQAIEDMFLDNCNLQEEIERLKEQLNDEIQEEFKQSEIMVKKQQEIERLNNIIKEVREYAGELRLYDNESIEFEISNDLFRILDKGE